MSFENPIKLIYYLIYNVLLQVSTQDKWLLKYVAFLLNSSIKNSVFQLGWKGYYFPPAFNKSNKKIYEVKDKIIIWIPVSKIKKIYKINHHCGSTHMCLTLLSVVGFIVVQPACAWHFSYSSRSPWLNRLLPDITLCGRAHLVQPACTWHLSLWSGSPWFNQRVPDITLCGPAICGSTLLYLISLSVVGFTMVKPSCAWHYSLWSVHRDSTRSCLTLLSVVGLTVFNRLVPDITFCGRDHRGSTGLCMTLLSVVGLTVVQPSCTWHYSLWSVYRGSTGLCLT